MDRPPTFRFATVRLACVEIIACVAIILSAAAHVSAQGFSPGVAPGKMTVPPGFEVLLVAAEPLVRQPVAIEFDDAGRLWTIQYMQYPNPAGLKRAKVDRYSRTTYDRVPEPPPRGPRGSDSITILEDTDGDGRADRSKDFVSGLNLASGLAFGHGGVFVLQVPYLLFYADQNHDDVPDGDPEVLLTGFGMEDAHSVANSLTWGPDGWLYGCQGSTVTSNIRGVEFQQGVWRYHPLSRRFELFCEGGGNSWGLDFDAAGNLFYSTNYGGYAMLHGVQGGYYWKQFGKHGALHNPHAYGYFDHVSHQDLRGGHVTVGGMIYQSDLFPTEFRGKYLAADLLGHAVYWHELTPKGSTFTARQAGDLLLANDTWFAPSDLTIGPEGAVYVCDWHDARTAHPDPDAEWDRTNGRIYCVRPGKWIPRKTPRLSDMSSDQLVDLLGESNNWLVRRARRLLADRRDGSVRGKLFTMLNNPDDPRALEALWTLQVCGGLTESDLLRLLDHPRDDVRRWTVRLAGDEEQVSPQVAARLAKLAAADPSVLVRSQLASTAKRLPAEQALPIVAALVTHDEDVRDPYVPLLVWWAVEKHSVSARDAVLAIFTRPAIWRRPLVHDVILPRLVRRYAAEGSAEGFAACAALMAAVPPADRRAMLAALDEGLRDRGASTGGSSGTLFANLAAAESAPAVRPAPRTTIDALPAALAQTIASTWLADRDDPALLRLAIRLGVAGAEQHAVQSATDSKLPEAKRLAALERLSEVGRSTSAAPLTALVHPAQAPAIRSAALVALAALDDAATADTLLAAYPTLDEPTRRKVCDTLLARRSWAEKLLSAVDLGEVARDDVSLDQLRLVALHREASLDALVKKHWGAIQGGNPEERLAEMRRINNDLRAASGDAAAGKMLYSKHCAVCHRLFGEGNQVGPELTHANRKKTDELLATIVSPSAVVRKEFMSFIVQTTEGRVLTGLLVEQSPGEVTLLDAKNERTKVPRDKIERLDESPTSLMPENLLTSLQPQELRDLFAYLQSDPPAPPAEKP